MNIQEKLLQVQLGLKAPKSQYNSFGKYYYRNCEDILEAAKPLLGEVKAILIVGDELIELGGRFYIKATATIMDCECEGSIENTAYAREEVEKKGMDASQVTGSTSSYARKYALNGLLCIDDTKDADSGDNSATGKKTTDKKADSKNMSAPQKLSTVMSNSLMEAVKKYEGKGVKLEKILASYHVKTIEEMTMDMYKNCMDKLHLYDKKEEKAG